MNDLNEPNLEQYKSIVFVINSLLYLIKLFGEKLSYDAPP